MQFLYQALAWGFLLTAVPVLIHLINMMRHKKVQWAAMDFLLQSYKKHRKWVWLKQFLLLLLRMMIVAVVVAMLAQWITRGEWLDILGGKVTHHYVLLDDSGSMGESYNAMTAFDTGSRFVQRLASRAAEEPVKQKFTVLRFSRAMLNNGDPEGANDVADLNSEDVSSDLPQLLEEKRNAFEVTQASTGPSAALAVARQLIGQAPDENAVLYVVSDFRTEDWDNPAEIRKSFRELEDQGARLELVQCVGTQRPNLGIVDIQPANQTRAAEVPLYVNIKIKNYSTEAVENVQLKIHTDFYDPDQIASGAVDKPSPNREDLPLRMIERIGPGETITERVQVYFPKSGTHVVSAELPEDGLAADNQRWCVVEFPPGEPVLVIDGDPDRRNEFYLRTIFQPGPRTQTGVMPDFQEVSKLRDWTADQLKKYSVIFLCDVERLDQRAIDNLEEYVQSGGGLAFFVGDQVNVLSYNNDLYRNGEGLFPLPLDRDDLLPLDDINEAPDVDLEGSEHPVFRPLAEGTNPLIRMVRVERYLRAPEDWAPDPDSTVQVIARLRNRLPLAVEKKYGEGRVMAFLSTYGPYWNDLTLGPNALVALLMQSYLAAPQRSVDERFVGSEIDLAVPVDEFRQDARIFLPNRQNDEVTELQRRAAPMPGNDAQLQIRIPPEETLYGGIFETWAYAKKGDTVPHRFAVNVDPVESNLSPAESTQVLEALRPVEATWRKAEELDAAEINASGFNRSLLLMCVLIVLLLGEQWLAYSASYHAKPGVSS